MIKAWRWKKTKKVILVLFFSVIFFATVAPVFAEPSHKIAVTANTSNQVMGIPEKTFTTEGGIIHSQYAIRTGSVWLKIDDEPTMYGSMWELMSTEINTKTGEVVITSHKTVWTFADGSFEGVKQTRTFGTATSIVAINQHAVLHGSGEFEGQALMISQSWEQGEPSSNRIYTGYLLIP